MWGVCGVCEGKGAEVVGCGWREGERQDWLVGGLIGWLVVGWWLVGWLVGWWGGGGRWSVDVVSGIVGYRVVGGWLVG